MNYVDHLNLFGVDAKEIPCIKGGGAPTTSTEGAVGLFYMNTDNGDVYKCTSVADGVYTWVTLVEIETPTNAKYFDIDYDGIVSLKSEYQVDGEQRNELPEKIVFSETINGIVVSGFKESMFADDTRVKEIVFPDTVSAIPENFCFGATNLKSVKNTKNITIVGARSLGKTRIETALFPRLKEMGTEAFRDCIHLRSVDIGEIEEIPSKAFLYCWNLSLVKGGANVKTIATYAFTYTTTLKNLPLLYENCVTNIGNYAFFDSRIQFDWELLTNCTFGSSYPTPISDNSTKYWVDAAYESCENSLVSKFNQKNPRWANTKIGNTDYNYGANGCVVVAMAVIHSAFTNTVYSSPVEIEDELRAIDSSLLALNPTNTDNVATMLRALGYSVEKKSDAITKDTLEDVYKALADGAYVMSAMSTTGAINGSHIVVLYGVNGIGEMLVVDSDCSGVSYFGDYENIDLLTYQVPLQNISGPNSLLYIVRKV